MTKICTVCKNELPNDCFYPYYKKSKTKFGSKCKECISEHYKNNKEKIKKYYIDNLEKVKQYNKDNYEKFKECRKKNIHKVYKRNRLYQKNNPEKFRMYNEKRRSLKNKLISTLSSDQWKSIKKHFDNNCAYCGENKQLLHQDHFVPLSKGGEYTINNIIPACGTCNSSKHNKDFFDWYHDFKYYNKTRERKILKFLNYTTVETQQLSFYL